MSEGGRYFKACECGGPHGIGLYVFDANVYMSVMDEYPRLYDTLDLRGLWRRVTSAWWILRGRHSNWAEIVLYEADCRELAERFSQAADRLALAATTTGAAGREQEPRP